MHESSDQEFRELPVVASPTVSHEWPGHLDGVPSEHAVVAGTISGAVGEASIESRAEGTAYVVGSATAEQSDTTIHAE